jgi:hypothetical protein
MEFQKQLLHIQGGSKHVNPSNLEIDILCNHILSHISYVYEKERKKERKKERERERKKEDR